MRYFVFTCWRESTKTFLQEPVRIRFKSDLVTFFELFKQELPQFTKHESFEVTPDVFQMLESEVSV